MCRKRAPVQSPFPQHLQLGNNNSQVDEVLGGSVAGPTARLRPSSQSYTRLESDHRRWYGVCSSFFCAGREKGNQQRVGTDTCSHPSGLLEVLACCDKQHAPLSYLEPNLLPTKERQHCTYPSSCVHLVSNVVEGRRVHIEVGWVVLRTTRTVW